MNRQDARNATMKTKEQFAGLKLTAKCAKRAKRRGPVEK
jgi:hypothetical protein